MHRIFLLLLSLVVTSISGCSKTESPQEAATRFFEQCVRGQAAEAYRSASSDFRAGRSSRFFETRVRELGFEKVPTWTGTRQDGNVTFVHGETSVSGISIPVDVGMVWDASAWRVFQVLRAADGQPKLDIFRVEYVSGDGKQLGGHRTFVEPGSTAMPTPPQLQALAQETLLKFDRCVKARDFAEFYDYVSEQWKNRTVAPSGGGLTAGPQSAFSALTRDSLRETFTDLSNSNSRLTKTALDTAFRQFMDLHTDFTPLKGKSPQYSKPPFISTTGVLTMEGTYDEFIFVGDKPPQPTKLRFKLEYVLENSAWRVFGISLSLK